MNPVNPSFLLSSPSDSKQRHIYIFLNHVFVNGDKKLPFRDLAPSRRTILSSDGPFSPDNLRTREGFFSAMVYRGITHNTKFLVDHQETMFNDADHFLDRTRVYRSKPDSFFCNKAAYGCCTVRTKDNAATYWRTACSTDFNGWVVGDDTATFSQLLRLFKDAKHFPAIGSLTGYLLAADYAIEGVVGMPTIEDIGSLVYDLKKGAFTGLGKLGFPCADREETVKSMVDLDTIVRLHFSKDDLTRMNYSPFVLEHMLCKFRRLSTKLYKDVLK